VGSITLCPMLAVYALEWGTRSALQ